MLLTSRLATFLATPGDIFPAATGICDRINELTDVDLGLWAGGPGYAPGAMAWSSVVESHAQYAEVGAAIMADAKYNDLVKQLLPFAAGPGEQTVRELVHAHEVPDGPPPVGSAAWLISAQVADGQISKAMTWAVEIAEIASAAASSNVALFRDLYGPWGTITWLTGYADMAAVDDANAKLAGSAEYMAKLDAAQGLFIPGAAKSGLLTRVH